MSDEVVVSTNNCWALRLCTLCFTSMSASDFNAESDSIEIPMMHCERVRSDMEQIFRLFLDLLAEKQDSLDFLDTSSVY